MLTCTARRSDCPAPPSAPRSPHRPWGYQVRALMAPLKPAAVLHRLLHWAAPGADADQLRAAALWLLLTLLIPDGGDDDENPADGGHDAETARSGGSGGSGGGRGGKAAAGGETQREKQRRERDVHHAQLRASHGPHVLLEVLLLVYDRHDVWRVRTASHDNSIVIRPGCCLRRCCC